MAATGGSWKGGTFSRSGEGAGNVTGNGAKQDAYNLLSIRARTTEALPDSVTRQIPSVIERSRRYVRWAQGRRAALNTALESLRRRQNALDAEAREIARRTGGDYMTINYSLNGGEYGKNGDRIRAIVDQMGELDTEMHTVDRYAGALSRMNTGPEYSINSAAEQVWQDRRGAGFLDTVRTAGGFTIRANP